MAFFSPDKTLHDIEKTGRNRKEKTLPRARIIRSGVDYEDNSEELQHLLAQLEPRAVVRGKVSMDAPEEQHGVNLKYSDSHYGLTKVETVEEMQQRHAAEIAELREQLELREKAAFEKGLAQGQAEGHDAGVGEVKGEFDKHIAQLVTMAQTAASHTKDYYAQVEEQLVEFALEIAKRLVGDAALKYREVAVRLAGEALKLAVERTKVVLKCNAADLETLKKAKGDLKTISEGIKEIEVEASTRLEPGSVILETDAGSIDATLQTMLDEVQQALLPEHSFGKSSYRAGLDVTKGFEMSKPGYTTPPRDEDTEGEERPPNADTEEDAE